MRTSRTLSTFLMTLVALFVISMTALGADPGVQFPADSEVNDQKPGSILFYNYYTSSATSQLTENTRINITNTNAYYAANVHLFFVADSCVVADAYICLTANQTASFLMSDFDPGFKGYIVALATDSGGWPIAFNYLIGDEYIKTATGHSANLTAEAFAARFEGQMPVFSGDSPLAVINLNGEADGYNRAPAALAVDNIPSRLDGNDTRLIINRVSGNLAIGASSLGNLFGLLYNDAENVVSFTISGGCQKVFSINNTEPRTIPRFESFVPTGRSGWMKLYVPGGSVAILGSMINYNMNAGTQSNAFSGGSNLHKLSLVPSTSLTIPVFPPSCR
ncbi:MAG: hypothetical protein IPM66_20025 [Acidobacteriota bacterium]|nr:MAG: hypothetical protein IPM66_20025 [Acidobacteriota bacterium]